MSKLLFFKNWGIVPLQCRVSFCCINKVSSHMHMCFLPLGPPPTLTPKLCPSRSSPRVLSWALCARQQLPTNYFTPGPCVLAKSLQPRLTLWDLRTAGLPLSTGFPRQSNWNTLPFPSLRLFLTQGIRTSSPHLRINRQVLYHPKRHREATWQCVCMCIYEPPSPKSSPPCLPMSTYLFSVSVSIPALEISSSVPFS